MPQDYQIQRAPRDEAAPTGAPSDAVIPHDLEAERSVIAAMLLSQEVLNECMSLVKADDFYLFSHRTIYLAMCTMFDRGMPVDPISLADYLKSEGTLARVGGMEYLLELNGNSFALASWRHHIDIMRRHATLRQIIAASARITSLAFDAPEDTKEVVERAESMLLDVTTRDIDNSFQPLEQIMGDLYNELGEMCANPDQTIGVRTGYPGIDNHLQGLRAGQMVVIGARPGVGKTSFALNLATNAAAHGASVAMFSLEMSKVEIAQRLLSAQAKIPLTAIRGARIQDNQWPTIMEATRDLSQLDIVIDDTPGTTVTEIRAKARRMLRDKPNGLVIVDYLQLLSPPAGGRRSDNRATEVSEMSRGIKIMAKGHQDHGQGPGRARHRAFAAQPRPRVAHRQVWQAPAALRPARIWLHRAGRRHRHPARPLDDRGGGGARGASRHGCHGVHHRQEPFGPAGNREPDVPARLDEVRGSRHAPRGVGQAIKGHAPFCPAGHKGACPLIASRPFEMTPCVKGYAPIACYHARPRANSNT